MRALNFCFLILLFAVLGSCKKNSNDTGDTGVPTNLQITAVASTDNSGTVTFTATATNAVSYEYDFGNNIYQSSSSGSVTYKYAASGTYSVTVTAKSSTGRTASKTISVNVTIGTNTSNVIWSDEFDKDGAPDPTKWGYDTGGGGWGNNELEYYTSRTDNAVVSNGTLKITAKKESYSGSNYTSARLLSRNKFSFKYGRIEIRAKLPSGAGTWPALWMLGNNIDTSPWPACGEMDIMEQKGNDLNRIFGTLHYPGHSGAGGVGSNVVIPTASSDFHVYALDWSPTTIKISVDGNVFYTFANTPDTPFNQNFFVIMNLAMGGNFGGTVDPNFSSATMEVDYVRVMQ